MPSMISKRNLCNMKQGWEIKKLKDISVLITDGDWIESRHQSDDGIRLIQTGNIGNGIFRAKDAKSHYISEETFNELGCTEIFSGDCLVSRLPEPVGRACIIPELDYRMITAVDCTIIRFKDFILPKFFVYYSQCSKYLRDINNSTTGTTRKRISRKNLESVTIPIPSILEQEKIVAELDCLSGIIEKKKQQLKEYDALAQSIFYEMFGNPVENEKGWEVKTLGDVCNFINGYAFKSQLFVEEGDKILRISNIQDGCVDITDAAHFDKKDYPKVDFKKYAVFPNDIVIALSGATTGKLGINKTGNTLYLNQRVAICREKNNDINHTYLLFYLMKQSASFLDTAAGVAQPNLSTEQMKTYLIGMPPLPIQQEFASKIEAIEKQKELIKQSIAETEILFNSRMDYYFN